MYMLDSHCAQKTAFHKALGLSDSHAKMEALLELCGVYLWPEAVAKVAEMTHKLGKEEWNKLKAHILKVIDEKMAKVKEWENKKVSPEEEEGLKLIFPSSAHSEICKKMEAHKAECLKVKMEWLKNVKEAYERMGM